MTGLFEAATNAMEQNLLSMSVGKLPLLYIYITFPERVIVDNIVPRNVIINRGAAEVDNHISRDDIFDFHPLRACNVYFIIPNRTLDPLFSIVCFLLDLPWWGEFQRECMNERCIFPKIVLFLTVWMLELITDVRLNKLRHKKWWRQTSYQAASFKWRYFTVCDFDAK